MEKQAPGPTTSSWQNIRAIQRDPIQFATSLHVYGDLVRFRLFFRDAFLLFHPEAVRQVLQRNHQNYDKNMAMIRSARVLLGNGLFTNNGENWLYQRRLIQPAFHRQRITAFGELITTTAQERLKYWQEVSQTQHAIDVQEEMERMTLRVLLRSLFKMQADADADAFTHTFAQGIPALSRYFNFPFPPLAIPTPRNRRIKQAIRQMDDIVYRMIGMVTQRLAAGEDTGDLLSMLLSARDEHGERMEDQQIRDEVITMLIGGFESTAETLSWTFYLLAQHPEAEERLHRELEQVLAGRLPMEEDLPRLPYLTMVLQESMRVFPAAVAILRRALGDDEVLGYHIPARSLIFLCPWVTHRHPESWQCPDNFEPEHFSSEQSAKRSRFAFIPFGGGPRQCIGNHFAFLEAQLILATIAQYYDLRLVPGQRVIPEAVGTLRPRGLRMTLHPRS